MAIQAERFKFLDLDVNDFNFDSSQEVKEILLKLDVEDVSRMYSLCVQDFNYSVIEFEKRIKLKTTLQKLLQLQNSAFQKLMLLKEEHEKNEEEKKDIAEIKALRLQELAMYEKSLGLKIRPHYTSSGSEYAVSFTFYGANEKNPQESSELVLVTNGITYRVTSCIPLVDGLNELVTNLNKTNDISLFILSVRNVLKNSSMSH